MEERRKRDVGVGGVGILLDFLPNIDTLRRSPKGDMGR